jgi:PAS domain S-box-containing protein
MNRQNVAYICLLAGIIVCAALIPSAKRRQLAPGTPFLRLLLASAGFWCAVYLLELAEGDPESKAFWARLKYLGTLSAPGFWFALLGFSTGRLASLRAGGMILLFFLPTLALISVWTHDFQRPFWQAIWPQAGRGLASHAPPDGPWIWFQTAYSFLLILTGRFLFWRQTAGSGLLSRRQTAVVFLTAAAPLAGNTIYILAQTLSSGIDLSPLGFLVSGLVIGAGLLGREDPALLSLAQNHWFKGAPEAVFVLDSRKRIAALNPSAQALLGNPNGNILGKCVYDLYSDGAEILKRFGDVEQLSAEISWGPVDAPQFLDLKISPLTDSHGNLKGRLFLLSDITARKQIEADLRKIRIDSEKIVQQRTLELQVTNQRLLDEIKERRRTQTILKESEERYRQLVEQPFDGVYVHRGGNIIYINQAGAAFLGAEKPGRIIGMPVLDFVHADYKDFVEDRIQALSRGEKIVPLAEEKFIRLDGKEIEVEVAGTCLMYEGLASVMVVFRDITDRKLAENRLLMAHKELETRVRERTVDLERANAQLQLEIAERERVEQELRKAKDFAETASRSKSDFLANMSHELRTPLNAIIGFSELLLDREAGELNSVQEEYLGDVLQSSRHLLALINDILDLSKVEAGKMDLELREVPLRVLLEGSLIMVKEKALRHGIELVTELEGLPEVMEGDERKLKQVVFNLLSNAVKFTPDGGRIVLRGDLLSRQDGLWRRGDDGPAYPARETARVGGANGSAVLISVADTGIGIQGEDLERIFNPFEQVEGSANRRYQGTGLGLSLSRRIVEVHGGEIWAESDGLGKGSTFRFLIPLSPHQGKEKADA